MSRITFSKFLLLERITPEDGIFIDILLGVLDDKLDMVEMKRREGLAKNSGEKNVEIRIKPKNNKADDLPTIDDILDLVKKNAKKFSLEKIKLHKSSPNSGKFQSIGFEKNGKLYDLVLAQGSNKGEDFEKELYDNVIKYLESSELDIDQSDEVEGFFDALKKADDKFKISNVVEFKKRSGSTKRNKDVDLDATGEIIGDYIIEMKSPKKTMYISLKNPKGATFANLGVGGLFDKELDYSKTKEEYKILSDGGIDFDILSKGLKAYRDKTTFEQVEDVPYKLIKKGTRLYKMLEKAWGKNYYYVKKKNSKKFIAFLVDDDSVSNTLLKSLKITKITYPYYESDGRKSKQFSMILENDKLKYKMEIRNTSGGIMPNQINVSLLKFDMGEEDA